MQTTTTVSSQNNLATYPNILSILLNKIRCKFITNSLRYHYVLNCEEKNQILTSPEDEIPAAESIPSKVKVVLTLTLVANMAYLQMAPFYPEFLKRKRIDQMYMGLAMAMFASTFIAGSLLTGKVILHRIERT
jgi:hypothetical protein